MEQPLGQVRVPLLNCVHMLMQVGLYALGTPLHLSVQENVAAVVGAGVPEADGVPEGV